MTTIEIFGTHGMAGVLLLILGAVLGTFDLGGIFGGDRRKPEPHPDKVGELELQLQQAMTQLQELAAVNQEMRAELDEAVNTNDTLRDGFTRFQKIIASLPVACIGVDVEGNIYEWNEAAQHTFGYGLFDVFEQPLHQLLISEEGQQTFGNQFHQAVERDELVHFEVKAKRADGTELFGQWNATPVRGANGKITSVILTCADITERIEEQQRLEELANKDALTGLFNRRAILNRLDQEHAAITATTPLSFIIFDVDKFKVFNDTHGHPAGDALLRRAGEVLKTICGERYMPGRYGGEEFVVVLPDTDIIEALEFAERIRTTFAERTSDLYGGATASFGVSMVDDNEILSTQELIQSADTALYAAKHGGRNQVVNALKIPNRDAA